jgi:hypothetical protein
VFQSWRRARASEIEQHYVSDMNISLVNTRELRKTNLLVQAWRNLANGSDASMSTEQLLNELSPDIKKYCAWGTVSGARCSASVEKLGSEIESCLTASGKKNGENRRFAGIVVGMMAELGNGLRYDKKPSTDDGAFRAQDGRPVKYRVAAVPTRARGDEHCGWLAIGDWLPEDV